MNKIHKRHYLGLFSRSFPRSQQRYAKKWRVLFFPLLATGIVLAVVLSLAAFGPISVLADSMTFTATKDAWVDQKDTDKNHGDENELKVKSKDTSDNRRSLVAFDLSSLPSNAVITSATLKLFMKDAPSNSRSYGVYRVLTNWVEGNGGTDNNPLNEVRWNNKPAIENSATSATSTGTTNNVYLSLDVTSDVVGFHSGSFNNFGWTVRDQNENDSTSREAKFRSREHNTNSERPKLEIQYTVPTGSISGLKFNDLNGNGLRDEGEPGLADWIIELSGAAASSATTDASGNYSFNNLADGVYTVCEVLQSGWTQTGPPSGPSCENGSKGRTVTVANGNAASGNDFANVHYAYLVVVKKTNDVSSDTQAFNFTLNQNGSTIGETSLLNGEDHTFGSLLSGIYTISESVPSGWDLTDISCEYDGESVGESAPPNGETVSVDAGDTVTCTFTNTKRASFTLEKISDPDGGSFQFDLTGPTQADIPASHTFISSGTWDLSNLFHGLYSLFETILSPEDWTGSQAIACNGNGDNDPSGSVADIFELTLNPGEDMSCTVNNTQDALITGKKFEDVNADGIAGADQGIAGWTVTATRQDDPETEDVEESDSYEAATNEEGSYILRVQPGIYHVCETLEGDWTQSYPTTNTENAVSCGDEYGYELRVVAGDNKNGNDFGNYLWGSISGYKWEDLNGDGLWQNEDENAEPARDEWTIQLYDSDENFIDETTTDEDGWYSFEDLTPGAYIVREVLDSGWSQIFPGDPNFKHTVTVTSGESEQNWNFGNFRNVTITGYKWDDKNGDGVWQKSCEENNEGCLAEPGLPDIIMALGRQNGEPKQENGQEIIPIEIVALSLTGVDGSFMIHNVGPGRYKLFEESRSGWTATNPAPRIDSFFDITYRIDLPPELAAPAKLVQDSFFDIFVELSGENVNQSEETRTELVTIQSVPLEFGNHQLLVISQEAETEVEQTSAVITWTTDRPGKSRVIYDTVSHSNASTTEAGPVNYGYAFSTVEDLATTTSHTVTVSGLTAGTTYFYRAISSASPESVSDEQFFTTSTPPPAATSSDSGSSSASVSGGNGPILSLGGAGVYYQNSEEGGEDGDEIPSAVLGVSGTIIPSVPSRVSQTPTPIVGNENIETLSPQPASVTGGETAERQTELAETIGNEITNLDESGRPQQNFLLAATLNAFSFGTGSRWFALFVLLIAIIAVIYLVYLLVKRFR